MDVLTVFSNRSFRRKPESSFKNNVGLRPSSFVRWFPAFAGMSGGGGAAIALAGISSQAFAFESTEIVVEKNNELTQSSQPWFFSNFISAFLFFSFVTLAVSLFVNWRQNRRRKKMFRR